jgi:asparagine synthase (glutamine-hydrolysing)
MCGIFSILNNRYTLDKIEFNFKKGEKRGPENSKLININNKNIWFGFHRLAINGYKDENAEQPFNINGIHLICNGEIYNWKELYSTMGITGRSNSDCEVIIYLYLKYGIEQTLQMIDGVFAFVLYDENAKLVYVARDTYGVRPLFIKHVVGFNKITNNTSNTVAFASELKQLMGFDNYNNIKQFTPGTYSKFGISESYDRVFIYPENIPFSKITSFPNHFNTLMKNNDITNACSLIKNSLTNAVEKRVKNTEREIACLLSGGLDSSLITALVNKLTPGKKISTWSIGMEGSEDLKYAKIVANHIGSEHHEIIVTEQDMLSCIESVIYDIESYDTTTVRASIGNWLISKYIKEHSDCKVVFNGDGSDEVCGGYLYFHYSPDSIDFDKECRKLLNQIHFFDVLRSDRSISSHGLEARTPFLDRQFVQTYMSINPNLRNHVFLDKCEKYLLRKAFDDGELLPKEILWRTKEAFSDGVSSSKNSWFEVLQDHIKNNIFEHAPNILERQQIYYKKKTPKTLEQLHYRMVFESQFKNMGDIIPYFWMPNFVDATDASARTLNIYKEKMGGDDEITSTTNVEITAKV